MSEEILEVVDEHDQVTGTASRSEIHQKHLLHRAVHIFLFNSHGELFLQRRSMTKEECPGHYDSSAAGHLNSGERYIDAAARELKEELGIEALLTKVAEIPASKQTGWEFIYFYTAVSDDTPVLNREEIDEGGFYTLDAIEQKIRDEGKMFTSYFKMLLEIYNHTQ